MYFTGSSVGLVLTRHPLYGTLIITHNSGTYITLDGILIK
jgi:hypothetical protein